MKKIQSCHQDCPLELLGLDFVLEVISTAILDAIDQIQLSADRWHHLRVLPCRLRQEVVVHELVGMDIISGLVNTSSQTDFLALLLQNN